MPHWGFCGGREVGVTGAVDRRLQGEMGTRLVGFTAVAMQIRCVTSQFSSWTLLTLLPSRCPRASTPSFLSSWVWLSLSSLAFLLSSSADGWASYHLAQKVSREIGWM